jgi:hypothetical protein
MAKIQVAHMGKLWRVRRFVNTGFLQALNVTVMVELLDVWR